MSISFDWEFDEDRGRKPPEPDRKPRLSSRQRRWLIFGTVLFVFLAAVGLSVRSWIDRRLSAVEKIEAELRGIVELELRTIAEGDVELFLSRQDPDDATWQTQQVTRYITDPDASMPGLAPAERPFEIKGVHVVGSTGRVELVRWFQPVPNPTPDKHDASNPLRSGDDSPRPLPFHLTWFYHLDDDGAWYHVASPEDYWGVPHNWHGNRLTVQATEIEAGVLDPIAHQLTSVVTQSCRWLDCPAGGRYTLAFENVLSPQVRRSRWRLPALYLVGLPQNDDARAAWLKGTELWLVEALARSFVTREDVPRRALYQGLVARLQAQLDLAEPLAPDVELLTQALLAGELHTLSELWEAEYDPDDPEGNRLLDAEVVALLAWIESRVGTERLFELLPALSDYYWAEITFVNLFEIAPADINAGWLVYLLDLTGLEVRDATSLAVDLSPLEPPTSLSPPWSSSLGDQVALLCDGRILVGNADGNGVIPLTAGREQFWNLQWSPDGRWLLMDWWHNQELAPAGLGSGLHVPYLLAADGSGGRILMSDLLSSVWAAGWSPDGRQVIYQADPGSGSGESEVWAMDVQTGEVRQLPGAPLWSLDGERVAFLSQGPGEGANSVLVAESWTPDADLGNLFQVAEGVEAWARGCWSSDGSSLAGPVYDEELDDYVVSVVDLGSGQSSTITIYYTTTAVWPSIVAPKYPVVTSGDLRAAVLDAGENVLNDGSDLALLEDGELQYLWVLGWSADDGHLVVLSNWGNSHSTDEEGIMALAVVPLDGSAPRPLAYARESFFATSWSPTDPNRLIFTCPARPMGSFGSFESYLYDLDAGLIYTATESPGAAWSPDGKWIAFAGAEGTMVTDEEGQERFALQRWRFCTSVVWNPVADLSALGEPIPVAMTSQGDDWSFIGAHAYWDFVARRLHVWGRVVNQTGTDQHIVTLIPMIQASMSDGGTLSWMASSKDFQNLIRTVSLPDGEGLPFQLSTSLPEGSWWEDEIEILVEVLAEPGEPTRDDLDIPFHDFDTSRWPQVFRVSGTIENPGPDLTESLTIVVTVYGEGEHVIGWASRTETDAASLTTGSHSFDIEIQMHEAVSEQDSEVYSYVIQLFGR